MERSEKTGLAQNNANLIASLVRLQRKGGPGLSKRNFEVDSIPKPAPPAKSDLPKSSTSQSQAADPLPGVSKRIEFFEKQGKLDTAASRTTVVVRVGTGDDEKVFQAHANTLRASSGYFRTHFPGPAELPAHEEINLPSDEPLIFELFIEWAKAPQKPITYQPGRYSEEPWISKPVSAWMLAYRLRARRFEMYALSQVIQNCAIAIQGPWQFIEGNAPPESSLLRFSNHWVAWNAYLSGRGVNEYTGLIAADHASQVNASTRDPRIFDIGHWYCECGSDINPKCEHDPLSQEQERRAKLLRDKPPPPEWGEEAEAEAQARVTDSLNNTQSRRRSY